MTSNAVELRFALHTSDVKKAEIRQNAVFIHAKLVQGGMDPVTAKACVEQLYAHGCDEGRRATQSSTQAF